MATLTPPHIQHICNLTRIGDVLYLGTVGEAARHVVGSIAAMNIEGATVRRTRGSERVTFANGNTLHFATVRTLHKARGLSVWHVVTDSHTNLDNEEIRETLRPCFQHPIIGSREWYTVIG